MLEQLFLSILNMSATASLVIAAVLVIRIPLKRLPKLLSYLLWTVVFFRLICPVSFQSSFSLLPESVPSIAQSFTELTVSLPGQESAPAKENMAVKLPSAAPPSPIPAKSSPIHSWLTYGSILWLSGVIALLAFSIISLLRLKKRLQGAVCEENGIFCCDTVNTPFVLGIFRPRIYLPAGLESAERHYILVHEQTHIRHLDHVIKTFSFLVLALHWFNPLAWLSFYLSEKDMEMACDESVIRQLGSGIKKDYSSSLLALASGRRIIGGTPLAFGEGDTKGRIKNILRYQKSAAGVAVIAAAFVILLGFCLITNPPASRASMKWARSLDVNDIQSIEMIVLPSSEQDRYQNFDPSEFPSVVALINRAKGSYVKNPKSLAGGGVTFYIVTKDGIQHTVSNIGNTYLTIDRDFYDAGYKWLSSWEYTRGDSLQPDDFEEITDARMSPEGLIISTFCENLSARMADAIFEEVQEIMLHTYEGINRMENFSVYFTNETEEDGVIYEDFTVGTDWTTVRKPGDNPLILGMRDALAEMDSPEDIAATQAYIDGWLAELAGEYNRTERLPTYLRARLSPSDASGYELLCSPYTESGEKIWVPMREYYEDNYKENAQTRRSMGKEMAMENLQN